MALPSSTYDTATLVNPGSSLTDFTLIVDLSRMSAAWWSAVDTTDGTKGRAAKDSGPTELACDWIDFDDSAETGLLRVKWSGTLASSGTQTLRIYPPQSGNASVAASDTYGSDNAYDSDWAAYWPLHDANDRTSNGYDLTASGGVTVGGATGKLGAATDFDGSDDRLDYTAGAPVDSDDSLFIAWANPDATNQRALIYQDDTGTNGTIYRRLMHSSFMLGNVNDGAGSSTTTWNFNVGVSASTWYMAAYQMNTSTSRYVFANDNQGGHDTTSVTVTGTDRIGIGGAIWGGSYFDGQMQHVQVHASARSADWIEYEYDQTNDQATFWGTWTNTPVAGGISIPVVMHHRRMMGVS
jgi:hypothetical protein